MAEVPYASDIAYLQGKASNGTLTSDNTIYQKLAQKSNVPNVAAFMASIAGKVKQV